jgi:hypothetical protein
MFRYKSLKLFVVSSGYASKSIRYADTFFPLQKNASLNAVLYLWTPSPACLRSIALFFFPWTFSLPSRLSSAPLLPLFPLALVFHPWLHSNGPCGWGGPALFPLTMTLQLLTQQIFPCAPLTPSDSQCLIAPLFCPAMPNDNSTTFNSKALSLHSLFCPTTLRFLIWRLSPCAPSFAQQRFCTRFFARRQFCSSQLDGSFLAPLFHPTALNVSLRPLFR